MIKINVGAGGHYLHRLVSTDWVDCDISPRSPHIVRMDASQRWPFADASADRVASEHCIEHMTHADGSRLLAEAYRVLKPGGRIRISCPDMQFLLAYFRPEAQWTPLMRAYMARCVADGSIPEPTACQLMNWFVRMGQPNPGCHTFIYDESTLVKSLVAAGFVSPQWWPTMQSDDEHFRGIEAEGRLPPGMLQLESMSIEATK